MEDKERKIIQETYLLQELDKLGQGSRFLWIIFAINMFTAVLDGMNCMSYVFITETPDYWCFIPQLVNANWTTDQLKSVFPVDKCQKYDYDYKNLTDLGYDKAIKSIEDLELKPTTIQCTSFLFNDSKRHTIVNEWELVCEKNLYRANTFLVYALGMSFGSGILGTYSDRYGRKNSLIVSIILQVVFGPLTAFVPWFWTYMICRFFTGMSISAMASSAYTLLSEVTQNNMRKSLSASIDSTFSVGTFFLIGMAFLLSEWRYLQLALSCFVVPIVILICFTPESPRWLISQNRHEEAQKIIEKYDESFVMPPISIIKTSTINKDSLSSLFVKSEKQKNFFYDNAESLRILFTNSDLRKKILIAYILFYVSSAIAYSLIFNSDYFKLDRFIYMSVIATTEMTAHFMALVLLIYLSCRKTLVLTYTIGFIFMTAILIIPEESKSTMMGFALIAKFCLSIIYTSKLVLIAKLFPSSVKNTAMGTCILFSEIGGFTAPYIVDILGSVAYWAPTTLCGILSLFAGILCLLIPRTKPQDKSDFDVNRCRQKTGSDKIFNEVYSTNM
ncbi:organic cation transporter protein-like [Cotesia typhae]|uniref:organic cation transporter protein-like n=1 Tax=Cotesia typhae TaxID=2053667 RepID=UPI003D68ABFC